MKSSLRRAAVSAAVVAIALGVTVGLTGCIQSPTGAPTSTAGSSATARDTSPGSPVPTATSTPTKFSEDCDLLLTAAQAYDFNPNYVAEPAYAPKPGSVPAKIAAERGQTCGWVNETSGTEIGIAITALSADKWAAARAAAAGGTPISTAGEHGYFAVQDGIGSAQFFFGSIWLDVSSADFASASDAEALYPTVVKNQLSAGG